MNLLIERAMTYWTSGGVLLFPLGIMGILIWAYFLRARGLLVSVDREIRCSEQVLIGGGALHDVAMQRGLVGWIADQAVRELSAGESLKAAFDAGQDRAMDVFRRDLVVLAALTAAAPLVGLLGTVSGMVDTFQAVAGAGSAMSRDVSAGISRALITTQVGLVVAIPGVFGLARLRRLLQKVESGLSSCKVQLLRQETGA